MSSLGGTVIAGRVKKQTEQLETVVDAEFCVEPSQVGPHGGWTDAQGTGSRIVFMTIT